MARFQHQPAVVVVQFRHRIARLVADRRETVAGRHGGVRPPADGVGGVGICVGQIDAGGVLPHPVQLEQAHLRGAVAGAFEAAAGGHRPVIGFQLRQFVGLQQAHPGGVARGQRPRHRGFDEAVVIVVAGVGDRPAAPRMRGRAPARALVVPDVPDRLFGVGRPALALAGGDARGAGVVGHRQVGDHRADVQIRVGGNGGTLAGGDRGFGLRDLLFDQGHRVIAVLHVAGDAEHQRRIAGLVGVARAAVHRVVHPGAEAGVGRAAGVDVGEIHRNLGELGRRHVAGEASALGRGLGQQRGLGLNHRPGAFDARAAMALEPRPQFAHEVGGAGEGDAGGGDNAHGDQICGEAVAARGVVRRVGDSAVWQ